MVLWALYRGSNRPIALHAIFKLFTQIQIHSFNILLVQNGPLFKEESLFVCLSVCLSVGVCRAAFLLRNGQSMKEHSLTNNPIPIPKLSNTNNLFAGPIYAAPFGLPKWPQSNGAHPFDG